jgi:hypothetical protein
MKSRGRRSNLASALGPFAKVGIPRLQKFMPMFDNLGPQARQIPRQKSSRLGERDRMEPILRGRAAALDVNVGRFLLSWL